MKHEGAWKETKNRLEKALAEVSGMECCEDCAGAEASRLQGKSEGIRLALAYMREAEASIY